MKNKIILLMLLSIITAFSYQESYEVLAHFEEIDVIFDECIPVDYNEGNDGINEKWFEYYPLSGTSSTSHFYTTTTFSTQTLKYYFNETEEVNDTNSDIAYEDLYRWDTDIESITAIELKTKYADSMKRWNYIYIYDINNENIVTKRKLINIVEGTFDDNNLIIYPTNSTNSVADTVKDFDYKYWFTHNDHHHFHYKHYKMTINVENYLEAVNRHGETYNNRVGAHEIGHVMGLDDLDKDTHSSIQHHEEALMGYGSPRQTNITYKDIAGAMITMGFHTASDHKWMYSPTDYGGYKLICSICNGVKYAPTYPSGSIEYLSCDENHSISSGNMMPVASYENKDYIKCKKCRYVASFENRQQQNYSYVNKNSTTHTATNNIQGLYYTFDEEHNYTCSKISSSRHEYRCVGCNYSYQGNHGNYSYSVSTKSGKHLKRCGECNYIIEEPHAVSLEDYMDGNNTVTCRGCNRTFDKNSGQFVINNINDLQRTENGSYILPNGIIILVEEDIQAYLDGTLVFRDGDSELM